MRVIVIILVLLTQNSFAQSIDTVYFGIDGIVASKDSAFFVRYYNYDSSSNRYKYKEWSLIKLSHGYEGSGELISIDPEIRDGEFEEFDPLGNQVTYLYKDNNFIDIVKYQDAEGNQLAPVYPIYLLDSTFYNKEFIVDLKKTIMDSLKAKNSTDILKLCTLAVLGFVIEVDGSSSNIQMIKGCHNILDDQIIEIIKQKKFKSLNHNGLDVRAIVTIPIRVKK
ncbi:energy transducer TonB [Marinigracilibium pacificum]|uniref:TonB-like protein n=1 Tax=Marinigracilibium pacificum TaxID=2729599 RepID=A0A848JD37_9BACT|nr:hypothetical protein [Marinigracilibium pacificum]NMM50912.1 hypothetical protein [Marinigracilibium pacificum]